MWKRIVMHHSLTKDGIVADFQAIKRYHMSWAYCGKIITQEEGKELILQNKRVKKPWVDIGYHWICEDINGSIEIVVGRFMDHIGAHTRKYNQDSLGICIVGNYDITYPLVDTINKVAKFTSSIMSIYKLSSSDVVGHCELDTRKTCPGKLFNMDLFRNKLK